MNRIAFRRAIIAAYGSALEQHGALLRSERDLPFPKPVIRAALEEEYWHSVAIEKEIPARDVPSQRSLREGLGVGLWFLDTFRDPDSSAAALEGSQRLHRILSLDPEGITTREIAEALSHPAVTAAQTEFGGLRPSTVPRPTSSHLWEWGFVSTIIGLVMGAMLLVGTTQSFLHDMALRSIAPRGGWVEVALYAALFLVISILTLGAGVASVLQVRETIRLSRLLKEHGVRVPFWRLLVQRGSKDPALEWFYWFTQAKAAKGTP